MLNEYRNNSTGNALGRIKPSVFHQFIQTTLSQVLVKFHHFIWAQQIQSQWIIHRTISAPAIWAPNKNCLQYPHRLAVSNCEISLEFGLIAHLLAQPEMRSKVGCVFWCPELVRAQIRISCQQACPTYASELAKYKQQTWRAIRALD